MSMKPRRRALAARADRADARLDAAAAEMEAAFAARCREPSEAAQARLDAACVEHGRAERAVRRATRALWAHVRGEHRAVAVR